MLARLDSAMLNKIKGLLRSTRKKKVLNAHLIKAYKSASENSLETLEVAHHVKISYSDGTQTDFEINKSLANDFLSGKKSMCSLLKHDEDSLSCFLLDNRP